MIWTVLSLAGNVAALAAGLFGWLKYRQAWRAGWDAHALANAERDAQRGKDRQKVDAEIGGLGPDDLERRLRGARDA